jgi:hypothetical protein
VHKSISLSTFLFFPSSSSSSPFPSLTERISIFQGCKSAKKEPRCITSQWYHQITEIQDQNEGFSGCITFVSHLLRSCGLSVLCSFFFGGSLYLRAYLLGFGACVSNRWRCGLFISRSTLLSMEYGILGVYRLSKKFLHEVQNFSGFCKRRCVIPALWYRCLFLIGKNLGKPLSRNLVNTRI